MLLALFVPLASASAQDAAEEGGALDATPESATNDIDEVHTVHAALDEADSDDEGGDTIRAELAEEDVDDPSFDGGLEPGSGAECTTEDGGDDHEDHCDLVFNQQEATPTNGEQGESTGTVTSPGKDRLRIYHDANGNGEFDEDTEDHDIVFKTWVSGEESENVTRLFGEERVETAVDISQDHWLNADGSEFEAATHEGQEQAQHVVVARADEYPDALAGTSLAVLQEGPLLLTYPNELHDRTQDEIERVLGEDADDDVDVYILGNSNAISLAVEAALDDDYDVKRLGGTTRVETAIEIAQEIDDVQGGLSELLLASAQDFPDAVVGGAAAANVGEQSEATGTVGAVLLSWNDGPPQTLQDYLDEFSDADTNTYALGGTAVNPFACLADDTKTVCDDDQTGTEDDAEADMAIYGAERLGTSRAVAEFFFDAPVDVGIARADLFPDSLTGGAHIGQFGGPVVLTFPDELSEEHPQRYLCYTADSIEHGYIYGGTAAVSADAMATVDDAIDGVDCPAYDRPIDQIQRAGTS